jgi:glycosyltransferase involved in cell wall biosynthesis
MCTYNGGKHLAEQLSGILGQTLRPFEVVVCDDASTDETIAILEDFRARVPFKVRVIRNLQRLGSTRNFDQALKLCEGDLIALADHDDRWSDNKLDLLATILESDKNLGGVFSDAELIGEDSLPTGMRLLERNGLTSGMMQAFVRNPLELLLRHDVVTGATMMVRAEMRGCYDNIPESWIHDAWLTWMIALHRRIAIAPGLPIQYRLHSAQQLGARGRKTLVEIVAARRSRSDYYARLERGFSEMILYCQQHPEIPQEVQTEIRNKRDFVKMRNRLPSAPFPRAFAILCRIAEYFRYDRGIGSLIKDLIYS